MKLLSALLAVILLHVCITAVSGMVTGFVLGIPHEWFADSPMDHVFKNAVVAGAAVGVCCLVFCFGVAVSGNLRAFGCAVAIFVVIDLLAGILVAQWTVANNYAEFLELMGLK